MNLNAKYNLTKLSVALFDILHQYVHIRTLFIMNQFLKKILKEKRFDVRWFTYLSQIIKSCTITVLSVTLHSTKIEVFH